MTVLLEQDITSNVLEALRHDSQRKVALIKKSVRKRLVGTFEEFAAVEGSEVFDGFRNRSVIYLRYVLQKEG